MSDVELTARLRSINKNYELARGIHVDIRQAADRIEALTKERDEAVNQQDSARHSVDVLAKRGRAMIAENAKLHDRIEALEAKLAKAADMMRSLAAMVQHAIGPGKDVFIEPDTGRKLSDAYATLAEIKGESHD